MKLEIGPLLLIIVGVLLLLSNLDIVPVGELKKVLATWWPALLILLGIIQLRKRR